MIVQNWIKKKIPEKSNDKTLKEIYKIHWAVALILQENQNAAKNEVLSLLFLKQLTLAENYIKTKPTILR